MVYFFKRQKRCFSNKMKRGGGTRVIAIERCEEMVSLTSMRISRHSAFFSSDSFKLFQNSATSRPRNGLLPGRALMSRDKPIAPANIGRSRLNQSVGFKSDGNNKHNIFFSPPFFPLHHIIFHLRCFVTRAHRRVEIKPFNVHT